jgi:hypothetical protein
VLIQKEDSGKDKNASDRAGATTARADDMVIWGWGWFFPQRNPKLPVTRLLHAHTRTGTIPFGLTIYLLLVFDDQVFVVPVCSCGHDHKADPMAGKDPKADAKEQQETSCRLNATTLLMLVAVFGGAVALIVFATRDGSEEEAVSPPALGGLSTKDDISVSSGEAVNDVFRKKISVSGGQSTKLPSGISISGGENFNFGPQQYAAGGITVDGKKAPEHDVENCECGSSDEDNIFSATTAYNCCCDAQVDTNNVACCSTIINFETDRDAGQDELKLKVFQRLKFDLQKTLKSDKASHAGAGKMADFSVSSCGEKREIREKFLLDRTAKNDNLINHEAGQQIAGGKIKMGKAWKKIKRCECAANGGSGGVASCCCRGNGVDCCSSAAWGTNLDAAKQAALDIQTVTADGTSAAAGPFASGVSTCTFASVPDKMRDHSTWTEIERAIDVRIKNEEKEADIKEEEEEEKERMDADQRKLDGA